MRILITGPQGSGKTTQAKIIAQRLDLTLVKVGDLLRQVASQPGEVAAKVRQQIEKGGLVDDQIVVDVVKDKLSHSDLARGFVMDGYPRRVSTLRAFDPNFDKVFYLDISDEEAVVRLLKRGRIDDTLELIKERLKLYHQETNEIINYYQSLDKLIKIDGSKLSEEVSDQIMAHLKA